MAKDHKFAERFSLMRYSCQCGHSEIIWNSRNGVTPFCTSCPSCNQPTLQHVEFGRDIYAPNHKLNKGQRFWRDGTKEEAKAIIKEHCERFSALGVKVPEAVFELMISKIEAGTNSEFQAGWPMLDIHK